MKNKTASQEAVLFCATFNPSSDRASSAYEAL